MEISRLFAKNEPETPREQFLAIQIQEGVVQTAVWQVVNGDAEVVNYGSLQHWENDDTLLPAVDASLVDACKDLPSEPDRVIFGLPEYWLDGDKIAPEYSGRVKAILEKLDLKPLGFVTTTEAILQFLKTSEGIPPSVVVVELGRTRIGVVVTHLGGILGREEVGRSADLAADVEEGLARIEAGQLPPRILVVDGVEPEAQQQLASYSWQEKLPFLHLPKVESLNTEFSVRAVSLAGGAEAARAIGVLAEPEPKAHFHSGDNFVPAPILAQTEDAPMGETETPEVAEDLGFVVNEDIRELTQEAKEPVAEEEAPKQRFSPAALIGKLPQFKGSLPKFSGLKLPKLPGGRISPVKVLIVVAVILLLMPVFAFAAYSQMASAIIVVEVGGQNLSKTIDLAVGDAGESGLPSVSADEETVSIEKSDSAPTTGEAVVGEKATGEMDIFNKTDTARTLSAGTVMTTSNNLKFILNSTTTIASRSAAEDENHVQTITPGKSTVAVTAQRIGAEYNISTKTSLSVADFPKSSLEAEVSKEFTGGTSRTVKAVSKRDRDQLLQKLSDLIKQEAAAAQEQRSSGENKSVPVGDLVITSQNFSKGVDEEAESVDLTLKAEVKLLRFSTVQLQQLAAAQLAGEVQSGFMVDPEKVNISIESVNENDDGVMVAKVLLDAQLSPQINIDDYERQLKGLPVLGAKTLLENLPNYKTSRIEIKPNFPFLNQRLPGRVERIDLQIQTVR